jgi:hypothetical protein
VVFFTSLIVSQEQGFSALSSPSVIMMYVTTALSASSVAAAAAGPGDIPTLVVTAFLLTSLELLQSACNCCSLLYGSTLIGSCNGAWYTLMMMSCLCLCPSQKSVPYCFRASYLPGVYCWHAFVHPSLPISAKSSL